MVVDKRLFVFMKHSEKARTLSFFAEKVMNRVQIKKYTVENI